MKPNLRLLTKIATLYYQDNLTHEELAQRLGLSRQTIGRLLQRARKEGIVEITIKSSLTFCTELESKLETEYHLKEAIVVTPPVDTEDAVKNVLGEAAAEFIQRRVQAGDVIGVSWSSTVLQCANQLEPVNVSGVTVVQLNGSVDRASFTTRAEYIVDRFAQAFNARSVTLAAPLLVDRPDIKESLLSDSRISAALDLANRATFVVVGVGDISPQSSLYKAGDMTNDLLSQLRQAGAVGDICGRYFDRNGKIALPEVDNRTLAVELKNLTRVPLAVGIAGTRRKSDAIAGMLKGGYCNVLIIDEETARAVLSKKGTPDEYQ